MTISSEPTLRIGEALVKARFSVDDAPTDRAPARGGGRHAVRVEAEGQAEDEIEETLLYGDRPPVDDDGQGFEPGGTLLYGVTLETQDGGVLGTLQPGNTFGVRRKDRKLPDVCLPSTFRYASSITGRLAAKADGFYVIDLSRNGLLISHDGRSFVPVSRHEGTKISDGDMLSIGGEVLVARVDG